jgi:pyruvate dehydrogenase (quinone)
VELQPIDFALFARSCGATGLTVEDPRQVRQVLRQAFSLPGPVVVEAVIDPLEPPLPGKITIDQAWQFAKSLARGTTDRWELMKTVAENKIREVI